MNKFIKTTLAAAIMTIGGQAMAQITLYQNEGWRGRAVTIAHSTDDMRRAGFNDRASSVVVERGRWEVCDDAGFRGQCRILRRGSYESLAGMGLDDRISSVRAVPRNRQYREEYEAPAPLPQASYEYRQRPRERLYDAQVTSVRAVVGPPEQRCWVEKQQVAAQNSGINAGGALAGALLGGVLGHQVGGGSGRDIATVGGALAGGAIGANVGRGNNTSYAQDVRRCESAPSTTPQYWDVTYEHRGIEHRTQLAAAPGRTIQVNRDGEPRM